jgi:long-chain fatty acid transport protein
LRIPIVLISLFLAPLNVQANPFDAFGVGTRVVALGGAGTASTQDSSANYYNPAALTKIPGLRLDLGYLYIQPQLKMNEGNLGVDRVSGLYTGVTLPKRLFDQSFAVSLSFFLPDDRITRIRSLAQMQPRFVLYDNRPQRVVITTSFAWEPWEGLSFGGGLTYLTNARGTVMLEGNISITDPNDTTLVGGIDVAFESVRYPTVSMHWEIDPKWSLGLTYRETFELDLDLTVAADFDVTSSGSASEEKLIEDGRLALSSLSTNLFSPRQLSAGIEYDAGSWLVTADITWLQWSAFKAPASVISIDLETGAAEMGLPATAVIENPNFHDIVIARVGLENELLSSETLRFLSRVGYFFEPSPAPDQTQNTNYADSHKHGTSLGFGVELLNLAPILESPLEIDWVFQAIWMQPRNYNKDSPADLIGDYRISGVILGSSLTVGVQF